MLLTVGLHICFQCLNWDDIYLKCFGKERKIHSNTTSWIVYGAPSVAYSFFYSSIHCPSFIREDLLCTRCFVRCYGACCGGGLLAKSCPTLVTPWTVACQASLYVGFPGKNTGVGCHFLLQGIFPTQELNLGLLHCRQILYCLSYKGSPMVHVKNYKTGSSYLQKEVMI